MYLPLHCIGSHDSVTATLIASEGLAPNAKPFANRVLKTFGEAGQEFVYNWAVTQSLTFTEQLKV